ncbi:hypothetical protein HMN09_00365200 [Mycena chlorophos]|uniref:Extracellular membrane protein CFEM domain-containing protein n=1 Tax=Mycena chlorophos TaxID=658473 RepID=A0A8H6WN91_MYCCL|nr:hypothetical protein HMN09_00365200 [Mycena chlorophos]
MAGFFISTGLLSLSLAPFVASRTLPDVSRRQVDTLSIFQMPNSQIQPVACQAVCLAQGNCGDPNAPADDCCASENSLTAFECLNCIVFFGFTDAESAQSSYNVYQDECADIDEPIPNGTIDGDFENTGLTLEAGQNTTPAAPVATAASAPALVAPVTSGAAAPAATGAAGSAGNGAKTSDAGSDSKASGTTPAASATSSSAALGATSSLSFGSVKVFGIVIASVVVGLSL